MLHAHSAHSVSVSEDSRPSENKAFFQRDLRNIMHLLDHESQSGMQVSLLDFAIEVIGRELEIETISGFLCRDWKEGEGEHRYEIPFVEKHAGTETVKGAALSAYHVITRPWKRGSLLHAVNSVFRYGFLQSEGTYDGTLYQELGLVVIENGRHHLAAAHVRGTASADLQVYSLAPCFSRLTTDGGFWRCDEEREPVKDYRIALLYELAHQRYNICQQQLFPEPIHCPAIPDGLHPDLPQKVFDLLQEKNDDLQYLKSENQILERHVNRLLKKLEQAGLPDDILKYTGQ